MTPTAGVHARQTDYDSAARLSSQQRRILEVAGDADPTALETRAVVEVSMPVDVNRLRRAHEAALAEDPSAMAALESIRPAHLRPERMAIAVEARSARLRTGQYLMPAPLDDWIGPGLDRSRRASTAWIASAVERDDAPPVAWAIRAPGMLFDTSALRLFVERVMSLYDADPTSAWEGLRYADYVEWQRQLAAEAGEAARGYWGRCRLADLTTHRLPSRCAAPSTRFSPSRLVRSLEWQLVERLAGAASRADTTLEALMRAVWYAMLARRIGQRAVTIGVLLEGREHPALAGVRGPCACYVPVTVELPRGVSAADTAALLEALVREHREWEDGFSWSALPRVDDGSARFPFLFDWQTLPDPVVPPGRTSYRVAHLAATIEPCELRMGVVVSHSRMQCLFEWDRHCYDRATVTALVDGYVEALHALERAPRGRLQDIEILGFEERRRLAAAAAGPAFAPAAATVSGLFAAQVARIPERIALVSATARLSFRELSDRADGLAGRLVRLGVAPGGRVAICLSRSAEQIIAVLAVVRAGGAFLPLDVSQPPARMIEMVRDAQPAAVICEEPGIQVFAAAGVAVVDAAGISARGVSPSFVDRSRPEYPAYAIYTSGSTGRPKAVLVSHASLLHSTLARPQYYRHPVRAFLCVSPLAFDSSLAGVFWTLCSGGTLVLPADEFAADPIALRGLIAEASASHVLCLPSLYAWLLTGETRPLCSLETVIVAGESCPPSLAEHHFAVVPQVDLYNEWGATECAVWSTVQRITVDDRASIPIGGAIPGASVYVAEDPWQLAPPSVAGEAMIGGTGVAYGYLGRPSLTAERFLPDAWGGSPGARLYRTGDRVRRRADGALEFLGRVDRQVKVRGNRVELEEIERALGEHPDVRECMAAVRADGSAIDAVVALRRVDTADAEARLRAFLAERVPAFMVPATVMVLDEFPKSPNGKVDRRGVMTAAQQRRTRPLAHADGELTPQEREVRDVWVELLGHDAISLDDNFFDIGGHSMLAIAVLHRLAPTHAGLRLVDLFHWPTVRQLAAFLAAGASATGPLDHADAAAAARRRRVALTDRRRAARAV